MPNEAGTPVLAYGQFVTDMVCFLVLTFAVFILVKKAIGSMTEAAPKIRPLSG